METSLHRELKQIYAGPAGQHEVRLGPYRIDAVRGELLVEIQHGPLTAIRDKVRALLADHSVLVVKPIVARKRLVRLASLDGPVVSERSSPKKQGLVAAFDELVHFLRVFPHPRLELELVLVEIEELRYPGHGRRRWRRANDFQVADQRLLEIHESRTVRSAADLWKLLPKGLRGAFDTSTLAAHAGTPRWLAQRIAYCLRHSGAAELVGKQGNSLLYKRVSRKRAA
jgi:hypothetical protein